MSDPNAWQLPTFYTADKKEQLRYKFKNVDLVTLFSEEEDWND